MLFDTVLAIRRDLDQFAQGFGGGLAVFHTGVDAEQAIDFVLLVGGKGLVVQKGTDCRAEVIGFGQIGLAQVGQELPEISGGYSTKSQS